MFNLSTYPNYYSVIPWRNVAANEKHKFVVVEPIGEQQDAYMIGTLLKYKRRLWKYQNRTLCKQFEIFHYHTLFYQNIIILFFSLQQNSKCYYLSFVTNITIKSIL